MSGLKKPIQNCYPSNNFMFYSLPIPWYLGGALMPGFRCTHHYQVGIDIRRTSSINFRHTKTFNYLKLHNRTKRRHVISPPSVHMVFHLLSDPIRETIIEQIVQQRFAIHLALSVPSHRDLPMLPLFVIQQTLVKHSL
jgi:hypothetical protein